ncbi:ribonuclease D [Cyanobacterium aponinum]|uniref:ribonuclease D n=1 Tax=Cyanobacterium aponinum TaxID=379064 RepID=UPI000C12DDC9|nr:ribonuclease D [Cyanobacterium aponinum]PHV62106.1 3'-5' exonuclease [Cyanobacterium aponinum IPPAS B-1201]
MVYLTEVEEIKEIILDLTDTDILWVDTEVADYQTSHPRLSLIQVLAYPQDTRGDRTYIIDVLEKPEIIEFFIDYIIVNENIKKVFHNANYDLRFFDKKRAKNIFCTYQFARKIPYYLLPVKRYNLKYLTEYLTDFKVDKQEQSGDWGIRPLSTNQLEYAKKDCVYLAQVYYKLTEISKQLEYDPQTENIENLLERYEEIEDIYLRLTSEIGFLKERIKQSMISQNIKENKCFKIQSTSKKTIKADLQELVKLIKEKQVNINFPITLTKAIQEKLGNNLKEIEIQSETSQYYSLKEKLPE